MLPLRTPLFAGLGAQLLLRLLLLRLLLLRLLLLLLLLLLPMSGCDVASTLRSAEVLKRAGMQTFTHTRACLPLTDMLTRAYEHRCAA